MRYAKVFLNSIGYELPPVVVTSRELETQLEPVYQRLRMPIGQLEALTGITERRWWEPGFSVSEGAAIAGRKALEKSAVEARDLEVLIYAGVCREELEPATACKVASALGVRDEAFIFDISNACLGVMNGIIDIANRIELGQIKAGMVVSCESARDINEVTIQRLLEGADMQEFTTSIATLTGGSGAVAVVLTDGSFDRERRRRLVGGVNQAAPEHHNLCRWWTSPKLPEDIVPEKILGAKVPDYVRRLPAAVNQFMQTDSPGVLKFGVALGLRTFESFRQRIGWATSNIDKVICHQVGGPHRDQVLDALGLEKEKDYSTYPYLGNIGTVSLPLTAAIAEQRQFLKPGDRVGFFGIGSGLSCLMLGWEW